MIKEFCQGTLIGKATKLKILCLGFRVPSLAIKSFGRKFMPVRFRSRANQGDVGSNPTCGN